MVQNYRPQAFGLPRSFPSQPLGQQPQWATAFGGGTLPGAIQAPSVGGGYSQAADASMYRSDSDYFASLNRDRASMQNTITAANANRDAAYFPAQASIQNTNVGAQADMYGSDRRYQGTLANVQGQQGIANTQAGAQRDVAQMGMYGDVYGGYYPAQASMYGADVGAGLGRYQADAGLLAQLGNVFGNLGVAGMQYGAQRYGDELGLMGGLANVMGQQNIAGMQTGAQRYGDELGYLGNMGVANTQAGAQMYGDELGLMGMLASVMGQQNIAGTQAGAQMYGADVGAGLGRYQADATSGLGRYQTDATAGLGRYQADAATQQAYLGAMIPSRTNLAMLAMQGQQRQAGLQQMLEILAPMLGRFGQAPAMPSITTNYGAGITAN